MNETAAWGLVAGVVLATLTGVVVPYLAGTLTRRSERIREMLSSRRRALDEYVSERTRLDLGKYSSVSARTPLPDGVESAVAYDKLLAQFTTNDRRPREAFERFGTYQRPEDLAILSTWAAGRNWRAAWAGRRLTNTQLESKK